MTQAPPSDTQSIFIRRNGERHDSASAANCTVEGDALQGGYRTLRVFHARCFLQVIFQKYGNKRPGQRPPVTRFDNPDTRPYVIFRFPRTKRRVSRSANNTSTRPSLRDGTEAAIPEAGRGSVEGGTNSKKQLVRCCRGVRARPRDRERDATKTQVAATRGPAKNASAERATKTTRSDSRGFEESNVKKRQIARTPRPPVPPSPRRGYKSYRLWRTLVRLADQWLVFRERELKRRPVKTWHGSCLALEILIFVATRQKKPYRFERAETNARRNRRDFEKLKREKLWASVPSRRPGREDAVVCAPRAYFVRGK